MLIFGRRVRPPPCPRKGRRPPERESHRSWFEELFSARASGHRALRKGAHMNQNLPTRRMREHPDLEQLKRQAKELLRGFASGKTAAVAEVRAHYHLADASKFVLHHAQLVLARSYGFESWP